MIIWWSLNMPNFYWRYNISILNSSLQGWSLLPTNLVYARIYTRDWYNSAGRLSINMSYHCMILLKNYKDNSALRPIPGKTLYWNGAQYAFRNDHLNNKHWINGVSHLYIHIIYGIYLGSLNGFYFWIDKKHWFPTRYDLITVCCFDGTTHIRSYMTHSSLYTWIVLVW